jgi:hypothetical protein
MKKSLRLLASTLLLVTLSAPAYGWGNVGHMAVAFVAYKRLKPATRSRVDALVALNPKIDEWRAILPAGASAADQRMMLFMIAATWADQIKGDNSYHSDGSHDGNVPPKGPKAFQNTGYDDLARHKYWHFVDLPFSPDKTKTHPSPVPNALTQINTFRKVLASNRPDALKSYDLVWLLHMVGDVHQPLHGTARFIKVDKDGDDGGNDVKICNPTCLPKPPSLHSFWDGLPGSIFEVGPSVEPAVAYGEGLAAAPAAAANDLQTAAWINESLADAKKHVYTSPIGVGLGPFTITPTYKDAASRVAERRVALAGARLANVLNRELR